MNLPIDMRNEAALKPLPDYLSRYEHARLVGTLMQKENIPDVERALAAKIIESYSRENISQITAVAVLNGAKLFYDRLVAMLRQELQIIEESVRVVSYPTQDIGKRNINDRYLVILEHLIKGPASVREKHVLVVDDVLVTGATLELVLEEFNRHKPLSIKTAVLVQRGVNKGTVVKVKPDYAGIRAPNRIIIGHGTGNDDIDRNYPDLLVREQRMY